MGRGLDFGLTVERFRRGVRFGLDAWALFWLGLWGLGAVLAWLWGGFVVVLFWLWFGFGLGLGRGFVVILARFRRDFGAVLA